MIRPSIAALCLLVGVGALAQDFGAWDQIAEGQRPTGPDGALVRQWDSGAEAFEKVCARCHTTGVGPEILGRDLHPDYVVYTVRHGFVEMPALPASAIDDATLAEIADLIATSTEPGAPPDLQSEW